MFVIHETLPNQIKLKKLIQNLFINLLSYGNIVFLEKMYYAFIVKQL
jgi:hypothetical protein